MRRSVPLILSALAAALAAPSRPCEACSGAAGYPVCAACRLSSGLCATALVRVLGPTRLRVVSLGRYWTAAGARSPVADLLCRFKYDGDRAAGHALAAMTARRTAAMAPTAPLVVPVPLTRSRMRVRGFNQAAWLAWPLSRRPATRLQAEALQRTRQAHSQVGLSAHSRTRRIGGDFRARRRTVAGARVLLVDDVLTTGATLLACDAALRAAGAAEVCALTLLASPRPAR